LKMAPAREKQARALEKKSGKKSKGTDKDFMRDGLGGKDARAHQLSSSKDMWFESFDPEAPLQQFSFTDIKKSDQDLLETSIKHMKRAEIPEKLINAFRRGIGIHHSGMNRLYRQAVEILFRRGFLTVVIATGTLSLGINMPCKTVVFSGDSAFLTALNYRQCSGRAGRRGFDLLGNVIFQDMPTEKALRLMSSKLPDINGHFPLTTVFVLRILSLLHGTDNAKYAMDMVDALLSKPRLLQGGEEFKHQVLHHVRYSIEYLRSQGLLNGKGQPIGFASCASRLYWVESSAFALHALVKAGYFHDMVREYQRDPEHTLRKLMLVLCHLFGRRPMRVIDSQDEKEFIKKSVSLVYLPELPAEAATILNEHNKQTLQTYQGYVSTFVDQHCKEPDVELPLTRTIVTPTGSHDSMTLPEGLPATRMRSPFVALSGQTDDFKSVSELCDTVRSGVFLEKAVIPHLDMGEELTTPLNAYLYDFYMTGSVKVLIEANMISRGDVWFLLNDFSFIMATIVTSFENLLDPKHDGDLDMSEGDDEEGDFADDDGAHEVVKKADTRKLEQDDAVVKKVNGNGAVSTKKAKLADSWDDDESDEGTGAEAVSKGPATSRAASPVKGVEGERELRGVHNMFKALKEEFDQKFKRMWA
jgi:ATP-dependent RNA helicase DDX60